MLELGCITKFRWYQKDWPTCSPIYMRCSRRSMILNAQDRLPNYAPASRVQWIRCTVCTFFTLDMSHVTYHQIVKSRFNESANGQVVIKRESRSWNQHILTFGTQSVNSEIQGTRATIGQDNISRSQWCIGVIKFLGNSMSSLLGTFPVIKN
jgi:hypothetical protein